MSWAPAAENDAQTRAPPKAARKRAFIISQPLLLAADRSIGWSMRSGRMPIALRMLGLLPTRTDRGTEASPRKQRIAVRLSLELHRKFHAGFTATAISCPSQLVDKFRPRCRRRVNPKWPDTADGPAALPYYFLKRPPRARRSRPFGDSEAEDEGRLPTGFAGKFRQLAAEIVRLAERPVAIGALDRLVQRLRRQSGGGRREMQPLPDPPRRDGVGHVQAVAHEDDSER